MYVYEVFTLSPTNSVDIYIVVVSADAGLLEFVEYSLKERFNMIFLHPVIISAFARCIVYIWRTYTFCA